MYHTRALHEVCFETEKGTAALERAPYIRHLIIRWQVDYIILLIVDQIAHIEKASVYVQVTAGLDWVRGNAHCACVIYE